MKSPTIIEKLLELMKSAPEVVLTPEEFRFILETSESFGKKEILERLLKSTEPDIKIEILTFLHLEIQRLMVLVTDFSSKNYFERYRNRDNN